MDNYLHITTYFHNVETNAILVSCEMTESWRLMCSSVKQATIGPGSGLSPDQCQASTQANAVLLSIGSQ